MVQAWADKPLWFFKTSVYFDYIYRVRYKDQSGCTATVRRLYHSVRTLRDNLQGELYQCLATHHSRSTEIQQPPFFPLFINLSVVRPAEKNPPPPFLSRAGMRGPYTKGAKEIAYFFQGASPVVYLFRCASHEKITEGWNVALSKHEARCHKAGLTLVRRRRRRASVNPALW